MIMLASLFSLAQERTFSGMVIDAQTKEPLPFVNVMLRGTTTGTTTDFDGNFSIKTDKKGDSLIVSYIGYKRAAKAVPSTNGAGGMLFVLESNTTDLPEVVIRPGENPAHRIIRAMIKNKPNNDRERLDYYSYEAYNKIEFDVNNINKKMQNSRLMKPFKFIFDGIDSSNAAEKPSLPLFLSESISDVYYRKNPRVNKEVIKASRVAGVTENKSISQFSGDLYQRVNIYDNNFLVFGKQFISPLSDNGLFYYRYYLIDSVNIDNHRCYHIQFKPRRKQELTFAGNMWIHDTTFALKRIEMNIAAMANINYVNQFSVVQEYVRIGNAWMVEKDRLVVDFIIQKSQPGFYGRKTTSFRNFKVNEQKSEDFYRKADNLVVEKEAEKRDEDYWAEHRHDSLSKTEVGIYKLVDTIQSLPAYKTWYDVVQLFVSGYKVVGPWEFGPYYNTISFNRIEGPRLRIGGRTSNTFSTMHELSGYLAYGFLDKAGKSAIGYRGYITKEDPRQMVYLNYRSDYEILGQSQNAFSQDNIIASVFRRNPLNNFTRVTTYSAAYSYEPFPGWESKISLINRALVPVGNFKYEYYDRDSTLLLKNRIVTSEIRLNTRFALDEKYIAGEFERISTGTKNPILSLQLTAGIKGLLNSDYNFQKIVLNLTDRIRINPLGYLDYSLEYGKIFGLLPYPLLELHGGNETYYYDPFAYNMMNFYEFGSDHYFTVWATHHFEGLFLNKIPLLRRLKWREVASAKTLWGSVSQQNRDVMVFPSYMSSLGNIPYAEASIGVENILRVLRFDLMWRLTYRDRPNIAKFGLRGTFQFTF